LHSAVGAQIAYTVDGSGPPIVVVPPWVSHLSAKWSLSGHAGFLAALGEHHTVVQYDRWGTGLSERSRSDFSLAADVAVLRDVADHLNLRRFALFGPSHGGPVAVALAHQEPRRVSHLIVYGQRESGFTGGETWAALRELMLANWPVATRSIAAVATQGGAPSDVDAFAELLQAAASAKTAVALQDAAIQDEVDSLLGELRVPTLVLHRRDDRYVSAEDAIRFAARIPAARLEFVEGEAHLFSIGDVGSLADRIVAFTSGGHRAPSAQLSPREAEVMRLVAEGCTNAEVAERLVLSVRTVERHLLNAYVKLGVRTRTEAAARWRGQGPGELSRSAQSYAVSIRSSPG
jgi:pimeloyl-ACP methyl ester carboxylesterase/DNA-binding CsgD family transcriptional regulator